MSSIQEALKKSGEISEAQFQAASRQQSARLNREVRGRQRTENGPKLELVGAGPAPKPIPIAAAANWEFAGVYVPAPKVGPTKKYEPGDLLDAPETVAVKKVRTPLAPFAERLQLLQQVLGVEPEMVRTGARFVVDAGVLYHRVLKTNANSPAKKLRKRTVNVGTRQVVIISEPTKYGSTQYTRLSLGREAEMKSGFIQHTKGWLGRVVKVAGIPVPQKQEAIPVPNGFWFSPEETKQD